MEYDMNRLKVTMALAVVSVFQSTALVAAPPAKVDICHNGGTYNAETGTEDPIQFIINVSSKSIPAHIHVHGDCPNIFEVIGEGKECELQADGVTVSCKPVTLCDCIDDPGYPEDPADPEDPVDPGEPVDPSDPDDSGECLPPEV